MSENTYILSKNDKGRLILDTVSHGERMQIIRGRDWMDARMKVTVPYYHNPGYGYFHECIRLHNTQGKEE